MRAIQSKILPNNWLKSIGKFQIDNATLSDNNKVIAKYIIPIILKEKEKSLTIPLLRYLIEHIILKSSFLKHYDDLPQKLIQDAFDEIKNEKGINLHRKLHSLFIELLTYQDLYKKGYKAINSTREEGSSDLIMTKNEKVYNFEVKFKESADIGMSRLYDYVDGYSLLEENRFLRSKVFKIKLKVDSLSYKNLKFILNELDTFLTRKEDIYDGKYLQIFNSKKRFKLNGTVSQSSNYINNFIIQKTDNADQLVQEIFIRKNGHLSKLIGKSKKFNIEDNFTGCIIWSVPFHLDISDDTIKNAFKKLNLEFDLFVYIGGVLRDEFNFFIPKTIFKPYNAN